MNWFVTALAAICLGLNIFSVVLNEEFRALSTEYEQRQSYLAEDAGYRKLNNDLVQALANLAASTGDEDIRQLLTSEGITYTVNEPPASATSPQVQQDD